MAFARRGAETTHRMSSKPELHFSNHLIRLPLPRLRSGATFGSSGAIMIAADLSAKNSISAKDRRTCAKELRIVIPALKCNRNTILFASPLVFHGGPGAAFFGSSCARLRRSSP